MGTAIKSAAYTFTVNFIYHIIHRYGYIFQSGTIPECTDAPSNDRIRNQQGGQIGVAIEQVVRNGSHALPDDDGFDIVLVFRPVAGCDGDVTLAFDDQGAVFVQNPGGKIAASLMEKGEGASVSAKEAAKITGIKKGDIYKEILN